jgi:prepilin-type N-terminal cleavage/methylation domain-containing protein
MINMKKISYKNGFTILEMSIVLVIIGLLVGTIVTLGRINYNSKLLLVIKELQNYKSAIVSFSNIYGNLPGDMDNATIIFGSTDVNGYTVTNGNGDGLIGNQSTQAYSNQEIPSAFQQLALAGLIQGQYSGVLVANTCQTNVPYSSYVSTSKATTTAFGTGNIYWFYSSNVSSNYTSFNSLFLSGSASSTCATDYTISANDAYNIDLKMDDGLPFSGLIIGYNANANNCTSSTMNTSNHQTVTYSPNTTTLCVMQMSLETYGFY